MDFKHLEFKKYKRVFAFGCSFTNYYWPTWADIVSKETVNADFFNFAKCGAGNLFISSRITEADVKFKFSELDLILVMWSSLCREDRYFHDNWCCPGNIFTQNTYDQSFVNQFCDPKGYLIRDMSLISLTNSYIRNSSADSVILSIQPVDYQQEKDVHQKNVDPVVNEILELYKDVINSMPITMLESEKKTHWDSGHTYLDPNHGMFADYHPHPLSHYKYLKTIGLPLTSLSKKFAEESYKKLMETKSKEEIISTFNNEPNTNHRSVQNICF